MYQCSLARHTCTRLFFQTQFILYLYYIYVTHKTGNARKRVSGSAKPVLDQNRKPKPETTKPRPKPVLSIPKPVLDTPPLHTKPEMHQTRSGYYPNQLQNSPVTHKTRTGNAPNRKCTRTGNQNRFWAACAVLNKLYSGSERSKPVLSVPNRF